MGIRKINGRRESPVPVPTPQLQPLSDLLVQKLNKKSHSVHPSGEKAICIVFIRKTKINVGFFISTNQIAAYNYLSTYRYVRVLALNVLKFVPWCLCLTLATKIFSILIFRRGENWSIGGGKSQGTPLPPPSK